MSAIQIKPGVYWVGAIDWDLRNFHGYSTQRGSTYNAYLIVDEKIVLVDTVKQHLCDDLVKNISSIIDPARIDYLVCNHVEMDHSGSLPQIARLARNATVLASPNGEKGLAAHFPGLALSVRTVHSGETVGIGKRSLSFVLAPMVHWPDSMLTYVPQEKLLLSNDAFGQHIATSARFDDETELDVVMQEAAKYYANIVLPYGAQVEKLLAAAEPLAIESIAPSHGIIWRAHVGDIVARYKKWAANQSERKAVIIYDTMWGSTRLMAYAIRDAFEEKGIPYVLCNVQENHISDIMTEVLSARYICIGSPTLNNSVLPTVSAFLEYLKGLAPKNRTGYAFGSYGWGGQSVLAIENVLEKCGFTVPLKGLKMQYVPRPADLSALSAKIKETL